MDLITHTHECQTFITQNPKPDAIAFDTLQHFYTRLVDCVTDHNHRYYIDAEPVISDVEYDDLFSYLKKIEETHPELISENSPTQTLVNQVAEGFDKAEHTVPLLSLENSYNAQDIKDFDEFVSKRISSKSYYVEPKFDGVSVELIFQDGVLYKAITRGDGKIGEDITANVKTIKNIPKKLKFTPMPAPSLAAGTGGDAESRGGYGSTLSVRGEIMMPKSVRQELNKEREEQGLNPFANTRNAAAGSIKLLDANEVAGRGLVCYVYDMLHSDISIPAATAQEQREQLIKLGLPVFDWVHVCDTIEDVVTLCEDEKVHKDFFDEDIDFDGLVIKINDITSREELGSTEHHPRRAIAYKFPAQQTATQIISVDYQIGRTGIVTPVANLDPVKLSGVTISRVSLHNFDFIQQKEIHVGDRVWIQRSGEVIPYVVGVIKDLRTKDIKAITVPEICPACQQTITHSDGHNYCTNTKCPAILKGRLEHFVSKQCMNIDGVGQSIIDILIEQKIIGQLPDLYNLTDNEIQQQIKRLPGFGDKKVAHIAKELEKSKSIALRRFLNGIGLPGVGKKTAQSIANAIMTDNATISYEALQAALTNAETMNSVEGIGEIIVQGLHDYFEKPQHIQERTSYQHHGITFTHDNKKTTDGPLSGQSFSLTGSFPISRESLVEHFEKQGATFHTAPTKQTNFMLIGDKAGSKKAKAQQLGLTIYEGRETVKNHFPFLHDIKSVVPMAQGLFG